MFRAGFCLVDHLFHHHPFLVLSQHKSDAGYGSDLLGLELRITTHDDDQGTGILTDELVDGLATFVIGHFRHAARVDDTDICHFAFARFLHPRFFELALDGGRFGKVELAPQREISRTFPLKGRILFHVLISLFGYKGSVFPSKRRESAEF